MKVTTSSGRINKAIEIAANDIRINIKDFRSGLLKEKRPVLLAGADYDRPWTRDASINTYNYLALYDREIARNTLLAVLEITQEGLFIGGQYWDCVIWALGAERYLDIHKDEELAAIAIEALSNTLLRMEKEEYSADYGLFRGAAVYGDGVSAYPDEYSLPGNSGCILGWPGENPERAHGTGYGIPMHVLSTNCAYFNAYMMLFRKTGTGIYKKKAESLKKSIITNFMNEGKPGYLVGKYGSCNEQEGLGIAFGLMFGILPKSILDEAVTTDHGIACVSSTFDRYKKGNDIGRHSGTIWSFINSFYAIETLKAGRKDIFQYEFNLLTDKVLRDGQFYEIYHPVTGLPYGGIQEPIKEGEYSRLKSCEHQAWSATGYMSMIINGISGFVPGKDKPVFSIDKTGDLDYINIENMIYRGSRLDISL